ncbi:unnamed protein product [Cunninghamella blakesleeana]
MDNRLNHKVEDNTTTTVEIPASDAKLQLLQEKTVELEHLLKIKEQTDQLYSYFEQLARNMDDLKHDAQGVATSLGNWNDVFRTMGLINTQSGSDTTTNPTLVHLPIIKDNPK